MFGWRGDKATLQTLYLTAACTLASSTKAKGAFGGSNLSLLCIRVLPPLGTYVTDNVP